MEQPEISGGPDSSSAAASHERPGIVVGMAVGLVLVLLALLSVLFPAVFPLDGEALLGSSFERKAELPFGLVVRSGSKFQTGERLIMLGDPNAPEPEPVLPGPRKRRGAPSWLSGMSDGKEVREDAEWPSLRIGPAGPAPVAVAVVWYPKRASAAILRGQFGHVHYRDLRELDPDRDDAPVAAGRLDWGDFEANYVQVRHFARASEELSFHDTMRVNLTLGSEACVLYLRWGPGAAGTEEHARALLEALGPGS